MVKKVIVTLLVSILLIFTWTDLTAQSRAERVGRKHMGFMMAERNLFPVQMLLANQDELGLSEDQVERINGIHLAHQEDMIKQQADLKLLEVKLASLFRNEDVDRSGVIRLVKQIGEMRTTHSIARIHFLLNVKDVLTPEQIDKIEAMKKERRLHHFKKRGMHRHGKR